MATCNLCSREYNEIMVKHTDDAPFCDICYVKWNDAYACCAHYSSAITETTGPMPYFESAADTYTSGALTVVQECLDKVTTRDPLVEEQLDALRQRQYQKIAKFDPSKVDSYYE